MKIIPTLAPALVPALALAGALGAALPAAAEVIRHKTPGSTFPILRASETTAGTTTVYLSGMVPKAVDESAPETSIARFGDTEAQTVSVLTTIDAALKDLGLTMGDVFKMQVFLVGPEGEPMDFAGFMKGYNQFFGTEAQPNLVSRSVMEVAGLVNPGWLVEIEVTAARP